MKNSVEYLVRSLKALSDDKYPLNKGSLRLLAQLADIFPANVREKWDLSRSSQLDEETLRAIRDQL